MLRVGWLIDGSGGPVLSDQVVVIDNGRIESIEPFCVSNPSDEHSLDLIDYTLMPALMDAHVHLAFSGTSNETRRQAQLTLAPEQVQTAIAEHLRAHLASGIIAVRDGGDRLGQVLKARTAHHTPQHLAATCWAWHAPGRYGGMIGQTPYQGESLSQAMDRCPEAMDHIKLIQSGINSLDRFGHQTAPQFSEAELVRVRHWALKRGLPVMVHANGQAAVQTALAAGCDSIEHGYFMGADNLGRMADQQVFWVPTAVPMAAMARDGIIPPAQADVARRTLENQLKQIAAAHQSGVRIALGTDAGSMGVDHGTAVRRELTLLMDAGLSLPQAIKCATLHAAQLMRLPDRGVLRPGGRADFTFVHGGPGNLPASLESIGALCIYGQWWKKGGDHPTGLICGSA
jgi:imidazolonepropionase-like amidohydrolase